ncbi:hypothetical protein NIF40_06910 [[Clostridium] leptum]|uniref:Uncharacterized protein n=1 Tax=Solibaculum mannosilyticum TaxID=2780922 RepID=A0A7I8D3S9_9FIRM|nr:hypothetical protein [Solibaculum mannosilyticum]MCO7137257.1 hypothetical protein [[Clostridium] leptum]BCI59893.1 hypothetical protein C12CBH8_05320 [Solibaculum mannosilyticum]
MIDKAAKTKAFPRPAYQEGESPRVSNDTQKGWEFQQALSKKQALHWENITRLTST